MTPPGGQRGRRRSSAPLSSVRGLEETLADQHAAHAAAGEHVENARQQAARLLEAARERGGAEAARRRAITLARAEREADAIRRTADGEARALLAAARDQRDALAEELLAAILPASDPGTGS